AGSRRRRRPSLLAQPCPYHLSVLEDPGLRLLAAGLQEELVEEISGHQSPIRSAGAHVGQRRVVLVELGHRGVDAVLRPWMVEQRALAAKGSLRCRGDAAVGDAYVAHDTVLEHDAVTAADRGDVLIEPLGDLV